MALEKSITNSIMKAARERGWWVLKLGAGPWQRPGLPDLLCVRNGTAVFLEVKNERGRVSPAQQATMEEIEQHGGARCEVVRSRDEALAALDR